MVYVDTSVLVKLYVREQYSREAANWLKTNNEAVPKTTLHELEFTNAVHLKQFRNEMTRQEAALITERFNQHETRGVYYRPRIDWSDVFFRSMDISNKQTRHIGCRSLDIIHIALALSMRADRFFTMDKRQAELAAAVNLPVVTLT